MARAETAVARALDRRARGAETTAAEAAVLVMWRKIEKALEDHLRREGWNVSVGFAEITVPGWHEYSNVSLDLEKLAKAIESDLK